MAQPPENVENSPQNGENAENSPQNAENSIPGTILDSFVQSAATALPTLLEYTLLKKLCNLFETAINNLPEENSKYGDLLQDLTALAVENRKLEVETKSHVRTVKEQAQTITKIIKQAQRQLLAGKNISKFLHSIEAAAKESLTSSEELRKKYDAFIDKVKESSGKAKASCERNEWKTDVVQQIARVGGYGGAVFLGSICTLKMVEKSLPSCSWEGASMLALVGLFGGGTAGWIVVKWPLAALGKQYQEQAKKLKRLDENFGEIIDILLKIFEGLTDISRLLGKLRTHDTFNTIRQDENSHIEYDEDTITNIHFLIQLNLPVFKKACEELKNCMPVKTNDCLPEAVADLDVSQNE